MKRLVITFDKEAKTLFVHEESAAGSGSGTQLLQYSFRGKPTVEPDEIERTLGQLVLFNLNRLSEGGLGFGDYDDLLERMADENLASFLNGLDLAKAEDQYDLATVMFSQGRRAGSWAKIEKAIELFNKASRSGHAEAKRFLDDDLPVVLPRLEEKLKPRA